MKVSHLFGVLITSMRVMLSIAPMGAYQSAPEVNRIVSDLNNHLTIISAKQNTAWLVALPKSIFEEGQVGSSSGVSSPPWPWYLVTGGGALHPTLLARLPMIPGRRQMPTQLKGKEIFGGSLSYTGYSVHLLPPPICDMLPSSERRFLWWDVESLKWQLVPERADGKCYPYPSRGEKFALKTHPTRPSLMLALSPMGVLLLLLERVRKAFNNVDLNQRQFVEGGSQWVYGVSAEVRHSILDSLVGYGALQALPPLRKNHKHVACGRARKKLLACLRRQFV
jgi:hypothetical protein